MVKNHNAQTGAIPGMNCDDGQQIKFSVNSTPITDDSGVCRGAPATFDDILVRYGGEEFSVVLPLDDIGKLGVPDAILLKPGPLTETEWEIMRSHDEMGVDILQSACQSDRLVNIIRSHHAWFDGHSRHPDYPTGEAIPRDERILAIANAYDAMVSDRVYRKGRSPSEAFDELRRCSGTQFDPELVERFFDVCVHRDNSRPSDGSLDSKPTAPPTETELQDLVSTSNNHDVSAVTALAGDVESSET